MIATSSQSLWTALLLASLLPAGAAADLKMTSRTTGQVMGQDPGGETVTYLKGAKMRNDYTGEGGKTSSTILDIDAQQMISLNHQKQTAEVFDLQEIAAQLQAISEDEIVVELKPQGEQRTIAGQSCQRHEFMIKVPFEMVPGERMDVIMSGPAWIAKGAPGEEDYRRFYLAAAEKGMFFGNPAAAKAQPGQTKAMTEMYRQLAKAGIAYATDMQMRIEGTGPMAAIMGKVGNVRAGSEVTAVSTEPLSDDLFAVPAGFKTKGKSK